MLLSRQQYQYYLQPLTLIPCHCLSSRQSSSVLSLIISVLITVLTTICVSTHASIIGSSTVPLKSCLTSRDCGDVHKVCVDRHCKCKPFFDYVPELDSCLKSFGSNCTTFEHSNEELCNYNKYLSCDDTGTCSCHIEGDSHLIYDTYMEKCVAPPGHQCDLVPFSNIKKECVVNAKCVLDPNREVDRDFFGVCQCVKGFVGKGETCVPEEGSSCELDGDCGLEGMRCLEGQCRCSEDRIYDKEGHDCKVQVDKECEVAKGECVNFADCVQIRNQTTLQWHTKCECALGYQEIPENKTCQKDSHENCGKGTIYDEQRGRCSLKVKETCKQYDVNRCVIHAFCGTGDKCQCFAGYEATGNGTCKKARTVVVVVVASEEDSMKVEDKFRESSTMQMDAPQPHEYRDDTKLVSPSSGAKLTSSQILLVTLMVLIQCVKIS